MLTRSQAAKLKLKDELAPLVHVESEPNSENMSTPDDDTDMEIYAPIATHMTSAPPQWLTETEPYGGFPTHTPTPTPTPPTPTFASGALHAQTNSRALAPQKTICIIKESATGEGTHTSWLRGARAVAVSEAIRGHGSTATAQGAGDPVGHDLNVHVNEDVDINGYSLLPVPLTGDMGRFVTPSGTVPPPQTPLDRQRRRAVLPETPCHDGIGIINGNANANGNVGEGYFSAALAHGWDSSVASTPTGAAAGAIPFSLGTPFSGWRGNETATRGRGRNRA